MTFNRFMFIAMLAVSFSAAAFADEYDGAYLDAPYKDLKKTVSGLKDASLPKKSNTKAVIALQTPVKSQAQRGTCSIFASTAILESMLKVSGLTHEDLDLSEEWLEYLATRNHASDGSGSTGNFRLLAYYGSPAEEELPYIGETWKDASSGLANERCGKLTGAAQTSCLLGHRDPALLLATESQLSSSDSALFDKQFLEARTKAAEMKAKYLGNVGTGFWLQNATDVKHLLASGSPVTLDLTFYFGAWNHRKETDFGMERDMDAWAKGIVGYPEVGSIDRNRSPEDPEGHSIVVVGYDDNAEITTTQKMSDGTTKTFKYTGVYYFKNSWGTGNFGPEFTVDGANYPGYGMITQKYAEEFGSFYHLPISGH